jgi:hypothetical protein
MLSGVFSATPAHYIMCPLYGTTSVRGVHKRSLRQITSDKTKLGHWRAAFYVRF